MMLVRRYRLNRLPQYHSPATNTEPTATKATLTLVGLIPCISSWLLKPGGGSRTSWKTDWVVQEPSTAFSAIQVGASSQTRDELEDAAVAAEVEALRPQIAVVRRAVRLRCVVQLGDAPAVDGERQDVDGRR